MTGRRIPQAAGKDCYVKVRKSDLEKLSTEVMQLREFLPKVLNVDLMEMLHKTAMKDQSEQEQLRQERLHLRSRLSAAQSECQREREEKLALRQQLWLGQEHLEQQAEFCTALGASACTLLWSASGREDTVKDILSDSKLEAFLSVAAQTLESFVRSLEGHTKAEQQDLNSLQFVLALAGSITNIAAVTCGRDYLANSAHMVLDMLMQLLEAMKSGVCSKLKVLMLMTLYNVSISVKGLLYIRQRPHLHTLVSTLLQDSDWEVCVHALRLLQSLLLDEGSLVGSMSPDSLPLPRIRQLCSSRHPALRQAARETMNDLISTGLVPREGHASSQEANLEAQQRPTGAC